MGSVARAAFLREVRGRGRARARARATRVAGGMAVVGVDFVAVAAVAVGLLRLERVPSGWTARA